MITELAAGAEAASPWFDIGQPRIDAFADATEDRQSNHVDPLLAAQGPFGTTVAHGFLTLSLIVPMGYSVTPLDGYRIAINYGVNRVRFPAPVPSGSKVQPTFRVEDVEEVAGGIQARISASVEREGSDKPVRVAELLLRYLR